MIIYREIFHGFIRCGFMVRAYTKKEYQEIEDHECNWTQDAEYLALMSNVKTGSKYVEALCEYDTYAFMYFREGINYNAATA